MTITIEEPRSLPDKLNECSTLELVFALKEYRHALDELMDLLEQVRRISARIDSEIVSRVESEQVTVWEETLEQGFAIYCNNPLSSSPPLIDFISVISSPPRGNEENEIKPEKTEIYLA